MKKIWIPLTLCVALMIVSCSTDEETEMQPVNDVTYSGTVKAIIDANCTTCHGDPILNGAPMDLLTREAVKEAIQNRNLIGRVEDGSMPPGNASDFTPEQVQAIKDWEANSFQE